MASRSPLPLPQGVQRDTRETGSPDWVSTLAYRSRAVVPPSHDELQQLLKEARARNHAEGVTGMMVYDEGRYFQWLEGPDDAVERVWSSVRHDTRHHAIELLGQHMAPLRFFSECDMKLSVRHTLATRAAVRLPEPDPAEQAARLARLLLVSEPQLATELVQQVVKRSGVINSMCESLFEPAARHLGDLWQDDACNEFDVALALGRLQSCWRGLRADSPRAAIVDAPALLVVPCPGESHMLGAALHADVLWQAGWDAHVEFPRDDDALDRLVHGTWFGALDLTLSAAFRREHWLPRLATTIARARLASRNPSLVVLVGGRVFDGRPEACEQVGANAVCASASGIESTLVRELAGVHSATGSDSPDHDESRQPLASQARRQLSAADDLTH